MSSDQCQGLGVTILSKAVHTGYNNNTAKVGVDWSSPT